jgi:hypothetical protein
MPRWHSTYQSLPLLPRPSSPFVLRLPPSMNCHQYIESIVFLEKFPSNDSLLSTASHPHSLESISVSDCRSAHRTVAVMQRVPQTTLSAAETIRTARYSLSIQALPHSISGRVLQPPSWSQVDPVRFITKENTAAPTNHISLTEDKSVDRDTLLDSSSEENDHADWAGESLESEPKELGPGHTKDSGHPPCPEQTLLCQLASSELSNVTPTTPVEYVSRFRA